MIKCPNCGRTAQVKLIYGDDLREQSTTELNYIMQQFKCGCGCEFMRVFKQEETIITNKESLR